ncbi:hypothetical protein Tco_0041571 [Tanacetum coccineum]
MKRSFRSLKKSVVNIINPSTNKAFQILEDPTGLESPFNGMYEFLAPFHILIYEFPFGAWLVDDAVRGGERSSYTGRRSVTGVWSGGTKEDA